MTTLIEIVAGVVLVTGSAVVLWALRWWDEWFVPLETSRPSVPRVDVERRAA